ncbi:MAG: PAS domain S-box protein [Deltaproteobacteria bacterium]|nr:PAS domain S-box protein [Deltaproteobacteria bacterium]
MSKTNSPSAAPSSGAQAISLGDLHPILSAILENTPNPVVIHRNGKMVFANPAAVRLLGGQTDADLLGKPVMDFVHPSFIQAVKERLAAIREGEILSPLREKFIRLDGREVDVEVVGIPLMYEGDLLVVVMGRDITEHLAAIRALEEREAVLRKAQEMARLGYWQWDTQTQRITCSPSAVEILGLSPDKPFYTPADFDGLMHPEDRERVTRTIQWQDPAITRFEYQSRIVSKKGGETHIQTMGEIYRREGQTPVILGTIQDISSLLERELQLKKAKTMMERAASMSQLGFWEWHISSGNLEWSEETKRIFGVRPGVDEVNFELFLDRIHPEDREHVRSAITATAEREAPYEVEHRMIHPDGQVLFSACQGDLIRDSSGKPVSLVGTVLDITKYKEAEQNLLQSQQKLSNAMEIGSMSSWESDILKDVLYLSPEALRLFGLGPEYHALARHEYMRLIHPEDRPRVDQLLRRAIKEKIPYEAEYRVQVPGRKTIHVRTKAVTEYNAQGVALSMTGVAQDISALRAAEEERRSLEKQMLNAQKMESLGLLAGGIAHDFNNMLVSILGTADLALMELPEDSPVRAHLRQIETAAIRAAELTNQMLAYSGRGSFQRENQNLSTVVEDLLHLLKTVISKKVEIKTNLDSNLPLLSMDPTQIRQVIMNLVVNASEAMGDNNGAITITSGVERVNPAELPRDWVGEIPPAGEYLCLVVADNGQGMTPDTLKKIYDPFFTTKFTGRGLGLAAVQGIVRGHKGFIHVESTLGKGTEFRVYFPKEEGLMTEQGKVSRSAAPTPRQTGLILVVEDEESIRELNQAVLERHGFEVLVAEDGKAGLEAFRQNHQNISLTLLDLTMPRMGGEEVFRAIRAQAPTAPILLTSGYTDQDAASMLKERNHVGFIQKPYRNQDLLAKVQTLLAEKA